MPSYDVFDLAEDLFAPGKHIFSEQVTDHVLDEAVVQAVCQLSLPLKTCQGSLTSDAASSGSLALLGSSSDVTTQPSFYLVNGILMRLSW